MGYMKKLREMLCGKRRHEGISFKEGTRPAIILNALCEGLSLSGWDVCKILKTHNGDRELRRVRRHLHMVSIGCQTTLRSADNGRTYKVTSLSLAQIQAARRLIVGKGA